MILLLPMLLHGVSQAVVTIVSFLMSLSLEKRKAHHKGKNCPIRISLLLF